MARRLSRGAITRGGIQPRRAALSSRARASFRRDALGRVVERDERVLSGDVVTSRYEYDVRGRLVSVTTNGVVAESYAYDANGNRLGGEYDAQDRQLAFGGAAYAYDLNGSMTNRNGVALTWNLFGRLMSVGDVYYWRDERQRLCYKEMDGELVKNWMWSGSRLVAEYDCAAEEISVFVYAGATAPAYMIRGGVTYRIVTDNQGSVRLVVNAETGEVAQRLDYDSFGRVLRDTNPGFQPFGFQGGLYDPDTGLVEFGCRWYDAETGRWISKDPILLDGGWNVYAFCDNDPINRTDPSGLCEDPQKEKDKIRALRNGLKGMWLPYAIEAGIVMHGNGVGEAFGMYDRPEWPRMDYATRKEVGWKFEDTIRRNDMMGNYMAGYAAGYSDYPTILYFGVRAGGVWFDLNKKNRKKLKWDDILKLDADSVPDILQGFADGYWEFAKDHPVRSAFRATTTSKILPVALFLDSLY